MNGSQSMRKPLNMLEAPVFPDIRRGPPRFRNAGKAWKVDTGRAMMETGNYTEELYGHAVLVQPYDYNKTIYGQSSHRDVVNKSFRPPPRSPYFDEMPLSRLPATAAGPIIPRNNPGTTSDGTNAYSARNGILPNYALAKYRIRADPEASVAAGHVYQYRGETRSNEANIMDLDAKISTSASAGRRELHSAHIEDMVAPIELEDHSSRIAAIADASGRPLGPTIFDATPIFKESRHRNYSSATNAFPSGLTIGATPGPVGDPKLLEESRRRVVAIEAGRLIDLSGIPEPDFRGKMTSKTDASAGAGFAGSAQFNPVEHVDQGRLREYYSHSQGAGFEAPFGVGGPDSMQTEGMLSDRISASADAGNNPGWFVPFDQTVEGVDQYLVDDNKRRTRGVAVAPHSEYQYRTDNTPTTEDFKWNERHHNVAITVTPDYRYRREEKYNPHFRAKHPGTSGRQLENVSNARPVRGIGLDGSHLARAIMAKGQRV